MGRENAKLNLQLPSKLITNLYKVGGTVAVRYEIELKGINGEFR